jgi:hypothetical protein
MARNSAAVASTPAVVNVDRQFIRLRDAADEARGRLKFIHWALGECDSWPKCDGWGRAIVKEELERVIDLLKDQERREAGGQ